MTDRRERNARQECETFAFGIGGQRRAAPARRHNGDRPGSSTSVLRPPVFLFSGLQFSRVVLDFLFCCHNLEIGFLIGDAPRSFTIWCGPFFHFPEATKPCDRRRAKKQGRGPILRKTGRDTKRAARAPGYNLNQ